MTRKQRRLILIGGSLGVLAIAAGLVLTSIKNGADAGLWGGALDAGGGWKYLAWFGYFKDGGGAWGGWIWHAEHGWLYPFGTSPSSVWLWYLRLTGWLWTSDSIYPFLWSHPLHTWLWYYEGTGHGSGAWFHNYATGQAEWL